MGINKHRVFAEFGYMCCVKALTYLIYSRPPLYSKMNCILNRLKCALIHSRGMLLYSLVMIMIIMTRHDDRMNRRDEMHLAKKIIQNGIIIMEIGNIF